MQNAKFRQCITAAAQKLKGQVQNRDIFAIIALLSFNFAFLIFNFALG
jgi:hypothetical protein